MLCVSLSVLVFKYKWSQSLSLSHLVRFGFIVDRHLHAPLVYLLPPGPQHYLEYFRAHSGAPDLNQASVLIESFALACDLP